MLPSMTTQVCARCRREAPPEESSAFNDWEALGDGQQIICPGCLTGQEQQVIDEDAMAIAGKVQENRLRRMAERQGYRLVKSRRRDPRAIDYGTYWIVDPKTNAIVAGGGPSQRGMNLDDIEAWLTSSPGER
jgi:hypothetical protein